jgi:hypothetical protein
MLTHPKRNRFMAIESISGLNLDFFDQIYFICLQEHEDKYQFSAGFVNELNDLGVCEKSFLMYLNEPTSSQSETVNALIEGNDLEGFIFVKDSDNYYECDITEGNQVAYFDLNSEDNINARNKSYIQLDVNGIVTNIVEKNVISSTFSCGGYGFADAKEFSAAFNKLKDMQGECYISHIIYDMMLSGSKFSGLEVNVYKDWGTLDVWREYKKQYKTLFVDIDGTLVTNSSIQFPPYVGSGSPLTNNIECLRNLHNEGKIYIVLTTSRPEFLRDTTVEEMKRHNMPYDQLVMGLPHCNRIVINDFAKSNTYPSCGAINITRNYDNLSDYLL